MKRTFSPLKIIIATSFIILVIGSIFIIPLFFNISIVKIILFFTGLITIYGGITLFKTKRLIEDTPTSKIRSLAMGLVEIYGQAIPSQNKTLTSPFTQKECVYYQYKIEEYHSSGKSSKWQTIRQEEQKILFQLQDDTGTIQINPENAQIEIPNDFEKTSGIGRDPPQNVQQFLKRNNLNHETFFGFNKKMRYTESYIAPKDKLYIMGTATLENNKPIIKKETSNIYYISDKTEKEILKSFLWKIPL